MPCQSCFVPHCATLSHILATLSHRLTSCQKRQGDRICITRNHQFKSFLTAFPACGGITAHLTRQNAAERRKTALKRTNWDSTDPAICLATYAHARSISSDYDNTHTHARMSQQGWCLFGSQPAFAGWLGELFSQQD